MTTMLQPGCGDALVIYGCTCKALLRDPHGPFDFGLNAGRYRLNWPPPCVLESDCPLHGQQDVAGSLPEQCACGWQGIALKGPEGPLCPCCKKPVEPGAPA